MLMLCGLWILLPVNCNRLENATPQCSQLQEMSGLLFALCTERSLLAGAQGCVTANSFLDAFFFYLLSLYSPLNTHTSVTRARCTCPALGRFSASARRGRRAFLRRGLRGGSRSGGRGISGLMLLVGRSHCFQDNPVCRIYDVVEEAYSPLCLTSPV